MPAGTAFICYCMKSKLLSLCLLTSLLTSAQSSNDSISALDPVVITGSLGRQTLLRSTATVSVVDSTRLAFGTGASLLPAINTIAGVRMEERSPSSYRLSIRGSVLRAPFGIRNVKVYLDEAPLTDASGNTYLNFIDPGSIGSLEIFKGPDGSLFGANSGGVVVIHPFQARSENLRLRVHAGSFSSLNASVQGGAVLKTHSLQGSAAFQKSDGYRRQSASQRLFFKLRDEWNYSIKNQLSFSILYSGLDYETPGGLTLQQFQKDPRQARLPTATLPGAEQQQTGIYSKLLWATVAHKAQLSTRLSHQVTLFGNGVDVDNPFITNYESRRERSRGFRTYLTLAPAGETKFLQDLYLGLEWQRTSGNSKVYDNVRGERGAFRNDNDIVSRQYFYFTKARARLTETFSAEGSLSLNHYRYRFGKEGESERSFEPQLMPRLALNWNFHPLWALRAIVSRGYSVPTQAEVFINGVVDPSLQPERGWNYETGIRWASLHNRFRMDVNFFHYRLQQAIVRQLDSSGREFFVNAGGTRQNGLEAELQYRLIQQENFSLQVLYSHTLSLFHFTNYNIAGNNYSGNRLTGVPRHLSVTQIRTTIGRSFQSSFQYQYNSSLPLNDAHTDQAPSAHLLQWQGEWSLPFRSRAKLSLTAMIDNVLDQRYSLGHDLNAAGGRYYNAAPARNYHLGLRLNY